MSSNPQEIKGPIAVTGIVEAQPGKGDELAQWFANFKARAESDLELGSLKYNVARFGDSFTVWEEYADLDGLMAHTSGSPLFQDFMKIQETLAKSLTPLYWPVKSMPDPSIRF